MKIKKFLTCAVLFLCAIFCFAGCSSAATISVDDIYMAMQQANRTNEQMLSDYLIRYYDTEINQVEINFETSTKMISGMEIYEGSQTVRKYVEGKKIKYYSVVYNKDREISKHLYEVADYTKEGEYTFTIYDLKNKTLETCVDETDLSGLSIATPKFLVLVISELAQNTQNITMDVLSKNKVEFSFMFSEDGDYSFFSYVKIVFENNKISSLRIENASSSNFEVYNISFNYNIKNFNIDVSDFA